MIFINKKYLYVKDIFFINMYALYTIITLYLINVYTITKVFHANCFNVKNTNVYPTNLIWFLFFLIGICKKKNAFGRFCLHAARKTCKIILNDQQKLKSNIFFYDIGNYIFCSHVKNYFFFF